MGARAVLAIAAVLSLGGVSAQAAAATPRPPALRLVAGAPKGGATAPGDATIELRFSAPLAPLTARSVPKLSPATPGAWSQPSPTTLAFTPSLGGYLPGTTVDITAPRALTATDGARLQR